jgi:hypothetical protein
MKKNLFLLDFAGQAFVIQPGVSCRLKNLRLLAELRNGAEECKNSLSTKEQRSCLNGDFASGN